jgi:hypothetical protein
MDRRQEESHQEVLGVEEKEGEIREALEYAK